MSRITALSLHEASHAVCGTLAGYPVTSITVVPSYSKGNSGIVHFDHFDKQQILADASKLRRLRARLRAEGLPLPEMQRLQHHVCHDFGIWFAVNIHQYRLDDGISPLANRPRSSQAPLRPRLLVCSREEARSIPGAW